MNISSLTGKRIWVAGHNGMVGSAICRKLSALGCEKILTTPRNILDLTEQSNTLDWLSDNRPEVIFQCAALVGGIQANKSQPVEFLNQNLQIGLNIINASAKMDVQKLVNFGSSCFYPKESAQPIKESSLLTGELEPTNEAYALAKIAQTKLCQYYNKQYRKDFITIVPTNLYGTGDNFDPQSGHVIASLISKFVTAKKSNAPHVELWGTGKPLREFMHVDDAANGILFLAEHYSNENIINLSGGETVSILSLARMIKELTGFAGELIFDLTKPDGMMKKSLDNQSMTNLGWQPSIALFEGLERTIREYESEYCL